MKSLYNFSIYWLILFLVNLYSCHPRIYRFESTRQNITVKDTVLFDWKTKGTDKLLFTTRRITQPPNDSVTILEFKLITTLNGKDSTRKIILNYIPEGSSDIVVFPVGNASNDSIVAADSKNATWKDYRIVELQSIIKRPLVVLHEGVQEMFPDSGAVSQSWNNKPYAGPWTFSSPLTAEEKQNPKLIPKVLQIKAFLKPVK